MKKLISTLMLLFIVSSIGYAQNWHQVYVGPNSLKTYMQ